MLAGEKAGDDAGSEISGANDDEEEDEEEEEEKKPAKKAKAKPKAVAKKGGNGKVFAGKTIVFTGTLTMKRNDAKKMAEGAGGKVGTSISKNTHYVVAGDAAGSKLDQAEGLGVKVLTEEEFENMVNGKGEAKDDGSEISGEDDEEEDDEEEKEAPKKSKAKTKAANKEKVHENKVSGKSSALVGKAIVFTGTLNMKRNDAKKKAEAAGARVLSDISGKTDIVVAGANAGTKLDKANDLGIKVITEAEFEEMI